MDWHDHGASRPRSHRAPAALPAFGAAVRPTHLGFGVVVRDHESPVFMPNPRATGPATTSANVDANPRPPSPRRRRLVARALDGDGDGTLLPCLASSTMDPAGDDCSILARPSLLVPSVASSNKAPSCCSPCRRATLPARRAPSPPRRPGLCPTSTLPRAMTGPMSMLPWVRALALVLVALVAVALPRPAVAAAATPPAPDMLLVATVDGALHALRRSTGHLVWSLADHAGPLVHTATAAAARSDATGPPPLTYIADPMGDGALYVHQAGKAIQRLPVSIKHLVRESPFRANDGTVYLGHKATRFLAVDAHSGRVLHDYGAGGHANALDGARHAAECLRAPLDSSVRSPLVDASLHAPIFLGRTDYVVSIHEPGRRAPRWNISFAEYESMTMDWLAGPPATTATTADLTLSAALGQNGDVVMTDADGRIAWAYRFPFPAAAVFDVVPESGAVHGDTDRRAGFHVMRQAPMKFPKALLPPNASTADDVDDDADQHYTTAFIGVVHGSLYALSSTTHFPLLVSDEWLSVYYPLPPAPVTDSSAAVSDPSSAPALPDAPPRCLVGAAADDRGAQCLDVLWDDAIPAHAQPPASVTDADVELPYLYACRDGDAAFPACLVGAHPVLNTRLDPSETDGPPDTAADVPAPIADQTDAESVVDGDVAARMVPAVADPADVPMVPAVAASAAVPARPAVPLTDPRAVPPPVGVTVRVAAPPPAEAATASHVGSHATDRVRIRVVVTLVVMGLGVLVYKKLQAVLETLRARRRRKQKEAGSAEPVQKPRPPSLSMTLAAFAQQLVVHYLAQLGVDLGATPGTERTAAPAANGAPASAGAPAGSPPAVPANPGSVPFPGSAAGASAAPDTPTGADAAEIVTPIHQPDGTTRIGRLTITDTPLGYGSHGTVVYRGTFEGREVAVKRLLLDFYHVAAHEVALLVESDDHYNVVRYHCKEQCNRFLYIALELCDCSLADVIEGAAAAEDDDAPLAEIQRSWQPVRILYQILSGLHHLHSLRIIHRDLKPQNILLVRNKRATWNPAGARVLISDFGLCKKLELDQSSFGPTVTHQGGTFGWRAPELLTHPTAPTSFSSHSSWEKSAPGGVTVVTTVGVPPTPPSSSTATDDEAIVAEGDDTGTTEIASAVSTAPSSPRSAPTPPPRRRLTRALDVFSLGCLFYYVLTGGEHPFGDRYSREINILRGQASLDRLDPETSVVPDAALARDMISRMIAHEPSDRPSTAELLVHPYFWPAARRLNFLQDVSDRYEVEVKDPPSPLVQRLEHDAATVLEGDWTKRIDRVLLGNLGKYRKYQGGSVLDLMRALRNKKHHYADLPPAVRRTLGALPAGFLEYFTSRFPRLFLHVYLVVRDTPELRGESVFAGYFTVPDNLHHG
ncbi:IRE protein kinase [Allomyces macrogynus ATCC 38327]|uniref:non-specific serine/threonine protein kinase n=1 Tax=Allomyces macrogynus (strain ATCC 38327) TaxID=578462 RepID=A0A0L0RWV9_ALLM3|nr:IRE protein kinase [Allomyces macrogynus ATCC 38327]|eukprot:KNE54615.1 IRE protein kinase [Allomyces macrogynus ATCC 38327]